MFSKLFLGFSFDYWPEERPAILFFAAILSIMGMYIFMVYYALKVFNRLHRQSKTE
jgi:type II secretory pathway component PulL